MRHGRAKAARKTLQFYSRTAGINPPYHVLLDGTFLVALVKYKFPLRERLDKVLQHASFTLYTTKSCILELEKLKAAAAQKSDKQEILEETIKWAQTECEILEDIPDYDKETRGMLYSSYPDLDRMLSPPGFDILKLSLSSSKHVSHKSSSAHHERPANKYFVACQDECLLDVLRNAGTVPCIRLARGSVLLLENPSKSGQMQATKEERKKWAVSGAVREEEKMLVDVVMEERRKEQSQQHAPIQQVRRKRKAREPNPLSCKKSSKTSNDEPTKKKRRKKKSGNSEDSST